MEIYLFSSLKIEVNNQLNVVQFLSKRCYGSFCLLASHTYEAKKHHFFGYGKRGYAIKQIQTTLYSHKFLLNGFSNKNLEIWLSNTSQLFVHSDIFHHMVFPCSKFDFTIAFTTNAVCSIHNRFPTLPHGRNETSHKAFSTLWCQQFLGIELIINWPPVALQLSILNIKHILTSRCVPHLFSSYEL